MAQYTRCPYCTKPIPHDADQCPYCGSNFGSRTINILRSVVNQALFDSDEDRRGVDRIQKGLRLSIIRAMPGFTVTS